MGGALPQAAAGLVRRIVQLLGGVEHALAGVGIDVGAAVQRPRHGADRNVQVTRKVVDAGRQGQFSPALASTGCRSGQGFGTIFDRQPIDILRHRVCSRKRLRKNVYGDAVNAVTFGLEGPDGRNAG